MDSFFWCFGTGPSGQYFKSTVITENSDSDEDQVVARYERPVYLFLMFQKAPVAEAGLAAV